MPVAMPNETSSLHKEVDRLHINGNGNTNGVAKDTKSGQRKKMNRKQSSPMMPAFMVSAPGKVIVFGEHAVVHGKVTLRIASLEFCDRVLVY
jgi:mevalonate kinase